MKFCIASSTSLKAGAALLLLAGALAQPLHAQEAPVPAPNNAAAVPQRVVTPSGLHYEDLKIGDGEEARSGMRVSVHYTGWLKSRDGSTGRKFDSSRDRGQPFRFPLGGGQVIQGWDEGVQGMRVGGVRRLIVPSALGYGMRGAGSSIPPNATLVFEIELISI